MKMDSFKDGIVVMDVRKLVPGLDNYNLVTMSIDCWNNYETQIRRMNSEQRVAKLKRCRKLVRQCLRAFQASHCKLSRLAYYLSFKRFAVTTAVIAYTVLRINNPKKYPVRKIVTTDGAKSMKKWLVTYKKRWATVNEDRGSVKLYSNESVFYNIASCHCHPTLFEEQIRPHVSLLK